MKKLAIAALVALGSISCGALAAESCDRQAEDKKLAGAAKASFLKKCEADSGKAASCEKQADEKKLHGAARNSFVKKCAG